MINNTLLKMTSKRISGIIIFNYLIIKRLRFKKLISPVLALHLGLEFLPVRC